MSATDSADDLERFIVAQGPVFATVLTELRAAAKRTHWMWFIFPQLRGLGRSSTAVFYGLASIEEARAYHAHPVLGERLALSTRALEGVSDRSLHGIFGSPDNLKFRSFMTLFARVVPARDSVFARTLDRWCGSLPDAATLRLLADARV